MQLKINNDLAELVGIILGDGHLKYDIDKRKYSLGIYLHKSIDVEYIKYVESILIKIFQIKPSLVEDKNFEKVTLEIYRKDIVESLISIGLTPGNKVLNQVGVPDWIINTKNNTSLIISCVRGLTDTDGSIYINRKENSIKIGFKNSSFRLINDFKKMCNLLDIRTSKITKYSGTSNKSKKEILYYNLAIQARDQVEKFLNIIKPIKWIIRKESYLNFIKDPFEYRIKRYSKEEVKYWRELYEKLGSFKKIQDFLNKSQLYTPKIDTIRRHLKKLLGDQEYRNLLKKK